jgi:hypothetical protein
MKKGNLRIEYMALEDIVEAPRNPKRHDVDNIKASMRRFGFTQPPGINETTGRLVAGHGRREALLELKMANEDPPANINVNDDQWMVPVLRGLSFATDEEAEAYLLADNRLAELGGNDEATLAQILANLNKQANGLVGTGYTPADIEALVAFQNTGAQANEDLPDLPDYEAPPQQPRLIIICKTAAQASRLRRHLGIEGGDGKVSFVFEEIKRELEDFDG